MPGRRCALVVRSLTFVLMVLVAPALPTLAQQPAAGAAPAAGDAANAAVLPDVRRILVLGDSITYGGGYVDYVELQLRTQLPGRSIDVLTLGIPSETVSGLSEEGHPFPRPNLHERLDRTLKALAERGWTPQLVVACYGMNDGIYQPLDAERFARFREGVFRLVDRAHIDGAAVTLLTPPPFDPRPGQKKAAERAKTQPAGGGGAAPAPGAFGNPFEGYNDVLAAYADWLLRQRAEAGWDVIDLHGPMTDAELTARQVDPGFALAGDGVHPGPVGHWLMARQILRHWHLDPGDAFPGTAPKGKVPATQPATNPAGDRAEVLRLIHDRRKTLADAWLTHIGHQRPGMAKGLPLDEAIRKAEALDKQIRELTAGMGRTAAPATGGGADAGPTGG